MRAHGYSIGFVVFLAGAAHAGVFNVMTCSNPILENWCAAAVIQSTGTDIVNPYGVVHAVGYDGSGGSLVVNVCTTVIDPNETRPIEQRVQDAIAIWNNLTPTQGNCPGECRLVEDLDPSPTTDPYDFESVVGARAGALCIRA